MDARQKLIRGSKQYTFLYRTLSQVAHRRGLVTYQDVARAAGMPVGAASGRTLWDVLGAISTAEHEQGRPMLSAVVVGAHGQPGAGFFRLAGQLGRLTDHSPRAEREFWKAEVEAVYQAWQGEPKKS